MTNMPIDWNALIQLVVVLGSVIYFIARLDATTKANQAFYQKCLENLHEIIDNKFLYLENTMNEKFNGVSERFHGIKHDISRLEHKQEESNRIKERLAIVEVNVQKLAEINMVRRSTDENRIVRRSDIPDNEVIND